MADKTVLVSPDGEREVEVTPGSARETQLRWDGYLDKERAKPKAKAKAARKPRAARGSQGKDSGSSSLTGNEKTAGSNPA